MFTKKVDMEKVNKNLVFPIVQGVPDKKITNIFYKIIKLLFHRRKWLIIEDYVIWSNVLKAYIFVPKGFIFDGASIPKLLHSILGPTGELLLGSCPHDEGYTYGGLLIVDEKVGTLTFVYLPKSVLDEIFKDLCLRENNLGLTTNIAKFMLTVFGNIAWKKCRKKCRTVKNDFPELYEKEHDYV